MVTLGGSPRRSARIPYWPFAVYCCQRTSKRAFDGTAAESLENRTLRSAPKSPAGNRRSLAARLNLVPIRVSCDASKMYSGGRRETKTEIPGWSPGPLAGIARTGGFTWML
jgi:hypothetical protein